MIIELDQYKYELGQKEQALRDLGASLDLDNKKKRIAELDRMMEEPDFWTDPEKANQYSTEDRRLKDDVKSYEELAQSYDDIGALIEMAEEEEDQDSVAEVKEMLDDFIERLDQMSTCRGNGVTRQEHPGIGKGTVYRNLGILSEEGSIRRVEVPNGPDRFDFTLRNHYHGRCVRCGEVFDVDIDEMPGLIERIRDPHGMQFLSYDIMFKAICPACQMKE